MTTTTGQATLAASGREQLYSNPHSLGSRSWRSRVFNAEQLLKTKTRTTKGSPTKPVLAGPPSDNLFSKSLQAEVGDPLSTPVFRVLRSKTVYASEACVKRLLRSACIWQVTWRNFEASRETIKLELLAS